MRLTPCWLILVRTTLLSYIAGVSSQCKDGNSTNISEGALFTHKPSNVSARPGDSPRFSCAGYYGPVTPTTDTSLWSIMWLANAIPVMTDDKYRITNEKHNNGSTLWSNLTVLNVTADDYNIGLTCILASARTYCPRVQMWILPYSPDEERDLGLVLAIVIPAAIILTLILSALFYHLYEPQISFFLYARCGCQRHPGSEYTSDVAVVHDEDDHTFVREHIVPKLKSLVYLKHTTMAQDLSPEQPLFEGTQELMRKSYGVMFIITPQIINEALFSHLLRVAVQLKRHIIPVLVHPDGMKLNSWEALRRQYRRSDSLDIGLQYLKTVRWPGERASPRQLTNFWCQIRRQLPLRRSGPVSWFNFERTDDSVRGDSYELPSV